MTEETIPEETTRPAAKPRLTDAQWAEIIEFYELGTKRMSELAEEYNITRQALSNRFKMDGVSYGSRAHEAQAAVSAGVKAALTSTATATVAAAIERYQEKRLDWIEETRTSGYRSLKQAEQLAKKIVADHLRSGVAGVTPPMAQIDDDLKAVHRFQKILAENATSRLEILRSDDVIDKDDIPNIQFEDLTDEDILSHHREKGLMPDDASDDEVLAELNTYVGIIP